MIEVNVMYDEGENLELVSEIMNKLEEIHRKRFFFKKTLLKKMQFNGGSRD